MDKGIVIATPVLDAAVAWMVRTQDSEIDCQTAVDLEAWLEAEPAHRLAWNQLHASIEPFRIVNSVPGLSGQLIKSIERTRSRRELALALPSVIGLAATLGAIDRIYPLDGLVSDVSTRTGERRNVALPDGSVLQMNARSRADLSFDTNRRHVQMREGTGIVTVMPKQPPLTMQGRDIALRSSKGSAMLTCRDGAVTAICLSGNAALSVARLPAIMLRKNEGYICDHSTFRRLSLEEVQGAAAWTEGRVILQDRPLLDMVEAYRPYHAGFISLTSAAAGERVSGLFDLGRLDDALDMVRKILPIRVIKLGSLIMRIDLDSTIM